MNQHYSQEPVACELKYRGCLGPAGPDKYVKDGNDQIRTDSKGRGIPTMWVILDRKSRAVVCNHCSKILRKEHPQAFEGKRCFPLKVVLQWDAQDAQEQRNTQNVLSKLGVKEPTPISSAA